MQTSTRKLPLPPPSVSEAEGGVLSATASMATVVVPGAANLTARDLLIIKWEGVAGIGTVITFPLVVGDAAGKPYPYVIGAPAIVANVDRKVAISYDVKRASGKEQESSDIYVLAIGTGDIEEPFTLNTTPAAITGTETLVRNASGGVLPYTYTSSVPTVVKVLVATSGAVQGVADGTATITVHDSRIPEASASYAVTVSGNTLPLTIDTADVVLAMGEELTRKATGGALPYVYTSTDPKAVVVVESTNGLIRGETYLSSDSGRAYIEVTDEIGQTASYRVQVVPAVEYEHINFALRPIGDGISAPWMLIESTVLDGSVTSAIVDGEDVPPYFTAHRIKVHSGTVGSGEAPLRFRLRVPFREVTVAAVSRTDAPSKMQAYSASGVLLDEVDLPTTSPGLITVRATNDHRIEEVRFVSKNAPDGPVFMVVDNIEYRG